MTWGFMSVAHIVSLVAGVVGIAVLYLILKDKRETTKIAVLAVLSFSGMAAIIYNLLAWNSPLEYLPLHLCSLNAMVLPIAVITKNKVLNNLLLLWSLGALFALIMNTSVADTELFGPVFCFYYFPHVCELGIPILMFSLGLVKKDVKCIASTMTITALAYTAIHFINLAVNSYAEKHNILDSSLNVIKVNYMYSITPENPLLELFYRVIPHQYWYMYLSFVVIAVYLLAVYAPDIARLIRARRSQKTFAE